MTIRTAPPDPHRPIVRAIRAIIAARGLRAAARALDVTRATVRRYRDGVPISRASLALIESRAEDLGWLGDPPDLCAVSRVTGTPVARLRKLGGPR